MQTFQHSPSRRAALRTIAAGAVAIAAPAVWTRGVAAQTLVVSDPGGIYTAAYTEAYYQPFTKETGIQIIPVVRRSNPAAEFKAQVANRNFNWDVSGGVTSDVADLLVAQNLVDKIDLSGDAMAAIPADCKNEYYLADSGVTFLLAYRGDRYKNAPGSFADMWDIEKFPGRRALRKLARDMIEIALRADGVRGGPDIYQVLSTPAGWDRAFAKLGQIRPHVKVWWDSSPQSTQLLQSGEVDMCPTFNGRAQAAADAGAPVSLSWNDGLYSLAGWAIPRGTPKADLARRFIQFCARADRQAAYTSKLVNGPTNPDAYRYIPKDLAVKLPTYPDNLKQSSRLDDAFWSRNKAMSDQRFNEWLLQG